MFRSIVVALDLESGGDRALPVARQLAATGNLPVTLLTVSSPHMSEDAGCLRAEPASDGEWLAGRQLGDRPPR